MVPQKSSQLAAVVHDLTLPGRVSQNFQTHPEETRAGQKVWDILPLDQAPRKRKCRQSCGGGLFLSLPLSPSVSLCPALTRSETRSLCLDPPAATPLHLESSLACNCLPATTLRCCVLPVSVWVCPTLSGFTTRSLCLGLACKSTFLPRNCVCLQLRCYYSGLPFSVSVCLAFSWPRG